ncbi:hypothetical protein AYO44_16345 [Planctomycetaceae bacterium SCGC AG-212-F19]|nr:hypothetical protein AYO44_16345 [Planctomycetaceae bacterium SCGC AG-212-F19]
MNNGWTGGQYSVFRVCFGAYLCVHFAALIPWGAEVFSSQGVLADKSLSPLIHLFPNVLALWDAPVIVTVLLCVATGLSLLFALGWHDRLAAVAIWYIGACLFGRNPLTANPALPFLGWMLLAHVFLPPAPYGSLAARGRVDPGNNWRMPDAIFIAAWFVMALGYTYSGYTKLVSPSWVDGTALERVLHNPLARTGWVHDLALSLPAGFFKLATWGGLALELCFAPLALFRVMRPIIWGLMLLLHLGLIVLIDFADLSLGMVMLHFFTFNPAWVRPLPCPAPRKEGEADQPEMIFYDGHCGLCHRAVRFVLAEDRSGATFRFAPLDSDAFRASIPEEERAGLPDSMIVRTADGQTLTQARGVLYIMRRLGGLWRVIATVALIVPPGLMDAGYAGVARIRHRLFARPVEACPILPAGLRGRFDY